MGKFEVGEYVVPLEEEVDECILRGNPYKVLKYWEVNGLCKIDFIDAEGDYRSRPAGLYRRMRPNEFRELLSLKEELEHVKKDNQSLATTNGELVQHSQLLEREINSLKKKLKTVHEVTSLIGGYE